MQLRAIDASILIHGRGGKSFSPSQSNLSHLFEPDTNRSFRVSLFLCSLLFSFFFFIPFFCIRLDSEGRSADSTRRSVFFVAGGKLNFHVSILVGVPRCSSLMVTRTRVSNEPARSLFYNILSHRFAGIFRENIFPVRKKERRGEWNLEKKTGIRIGNLVVSPSRSSFVSSFLVVFNFLSLLRSISLSSTHETNSAQGVFKSGNVRLSRCATFEIEHNGATLSLSLYLFFLSPFDSWTTPV